MKVHAQLLGRLPKISRIDPSLVSRTREPASEELPVEEAVEEAPEAPLEEEAPEEKVELTPEAPPEEEKEEEAPEEEKEKAPPEVKEEEKVEPFEELLSLNAQAFGEELHTGKHDGVLLEILAAEEAGRNRKGHKSRLEERIHPKAS